MPAKPRPSTSATLLRGACASAETVSPAQRDRAAERRDAGHHVARERRERERRLEDAGGCDRVPDRPLEACHGRHRVAEDAPDRRRLRNIGLRRAVAVGDDHADGGGRELRVVERLPDRARDTVAVVANGGETLRFADIAAAKHLAQHGRLPRGGGGFGFEKQRAGAFAEQAAVVARIERPQHLAREEAQPVVVEQHLRLDGRLVPDGHRAVGLAVAKRLQASMTASAPPTL